MRYFMILLVFLASCAAPEVETVRHSIHRPSSDTFVGFYSGTVFAEAKNCDSPQVDSVVLSFHLIRDENNTAASFTIMLLEGSADVDSFHVTDHWVVVDNTGRNNLHTVTLIGTEIEETRAHLQYITTFSWGNDGDSCTILYTGDVSRSKE